MPCQTPATLPCRPGCGACCIAPSISSPIPDRSAAAHAAPKPAGTACVQLDDDLRCRLFGKPERPAVCASLAPHLAMCGPDRHHALAWLTQLERDTAPAPPQG